MNLIVVLLIIIKPVLLTHYVLEEHPCNSIIVITYDEFDQLNNCTVVFGYVLIAYPPDYEPDYEKELVRNLTFPLREVTGFLMFHDIYGILSPGSLFPNLTIIRGTRLFHNYALLMDETGFQELNFKNLLRISRGSVSLSGYNGNLCMPKIDWDSIIMNGHVVINMKNSLKSDCDSQDSHCHSCKSGFCWNNQTCQRFDKINTVSGSKKIKCHPLCLGKCVNRTAKGCFTCRDISELGECVQQCSEFRYLNVDTRRCITSDECAEAGRLIHGKECVRRCPAHYMPKMKKVETIPSDNYCVPCVGVCPRTCSIFRDIRSVGDLEKLGSGCTIIDGDLEINFKDDHRNLTAELEAYLGHVEEIRGALIIHRSTPITTLSFLNKLRLVYGLESDKMTFSIRIFENQNLQSIFDWRLRNGTTLEVRHGDIQIYSNNMLCESEIEQFKKILIQKNPRDMAMHLSNNGNLLSCRSENIKVYERVLSSDTVEIAWFDRVKEENKDEGYKYILKYLIIDADEEKEFEEHILFERDTCSSYTWTSKILEDHKIIKPNKTHFPNATKSYILSNLKQFTTYVYTIHRSPYYFFNTIITEGNSSVSGISEPRRFKTLMNIPSRVSKFSVPNKTSTSITLSWNVLKSEEAAINRYLLYFWEVPVIQSQLSIRDYCLEPIEYEVPSIRVKRDLVQKSNSSCCTKCCEGTKHQTTEIEHEDDFAQSIIKFSETTQRSDPERHTTEIRNNKSFQQYRSISEEIRTYTVTNLKPYTSYAFQLYVCAEHCGEYELLYMRTAYDENYDQLNLLKQEYEGIDFRIKFDEPKLKNVAITSYIIEIQEVNDLFRKTECFSCQHFIGNSSVYATKDLQPGDYIFRIRAVSLAQRGAFTSWHRYKVIDPYEKFKIELTVSILSIFLLAVVIVVAVKLYYRHRNRMLFRHRENDDMLMHEMDVFDLNDSIDQRNSSHLDPLEVIYEHEDE
ncbi:insulin receptor-like [Chironomus tepperi]|uniref:insulin receptor-like n=1 Tax=Chironomus tepperi TaxID=113505 RepID=UPI00391F569E